jgi:predicted AAA+ superfamily ATPase
MLTGNNKVRSDVFEEALDEKMAPSLGGVELGKEHEMYVNPEKFFERTLITEQIVSILENIVSVLKGESGKKILVLNAFYGGGKTHTLLTIYYALKSPNALSKATPENEDIRKRINKFIEDVTKLQRPDLIVFDGYFSELSPSPISPLDVKGYKVRTIWGYIAHILGSYSLLKEYDEKQIPPGASELLKLLENRKVIILIDEIAHYIKKFHGAAEENLLKYSSAVETFMEALAKALELAKHVILVISLPAERKEKEEIAVEITYQPIKQSIERIFKALGRIYTEYIEPIAPRNIPALLRTRLFENIDIARAGIIYNTLRRTYEENKEIFGTQVTWIGEIMETYPFHPLYIDTLKDILEKHEGLQKTRDLLRISRKVVREVLRENRPYDLIMSWHIDLTKDPIGNTLLIGDYQEFKPIIEEDIKKRVQEYVGKPLLAKIIATALLVKTFVYGGGLAIIPPKPEALPSDKDLAQMVYEPAIFQDENWMPKDIADAVKWISENLMYVVRDDRTGRFWFTKYVTPVKYVEERAKGVDDLRAINRVLDYTKKLLMETADSVTRRRPRIVPPRVFDAEHSQAFKICEPIDEDAKRYVLLAFLDVPEKENERKSKLEEVLYKTKSGGTRSYANTIYVIFPSTDRRIQEPLYYAKILIACEEVEKEGIIDRLSEIFRGKDAEIARDILKKKLERYKEGVLEKFIRFTLNIFDRIAYPDYDEKRLANTVKEVELTSQEDTLITSAERILSLSSVGKLKTDMGFDTLEFYLKKIGVDISNGEPRTVGTIVSYFYSNPRLPAVPKDVILDAIRDGVKKIEIGIRSRGRIYFKKIYTEPPQVSEGETVGMLDENDEVLPWRIALVEQMKVLKKRELFEEGVRKVEEYVIKIAGKEVSVEEALSNIEKFDLEQLRLAPIIRVVKTVAVKLEIDKRTIELKLGESLSKEIYVSRIGPYAGEIFLKPSAGKIDKDKLKIDESFTKEKIIWTIDDVPKQAGEYSYVLEAIDSKGIKLDTVEIRVRILGEEVGWMEGIPPTGAKVREMEIMVEEDKFTLKPLDIFKKRLSGVAVISKANFNMIMEISEEEKSSVELNINNIQIDDALSLIMTVISKLQLFKKVGVSLRFGLKPIKGEYFVMPEISEDDRKALLEHKVKYFIHSVK